MLLLTLLVSFNSPVFAQNSADADIQQIIRNVEDQNDLFCTKDRTPGFFQHFKFCSGDSMFGMPCAIKTIYECKNREGALKKKIKTWVRVDSRGKAKELVKHRIMELD